MTGRGVPSSRAADDGTAPKARVALTVRPAAVDRIAALSLSNPCTFSVLTNLYGPHWSFLFGLSSEKFKEP